MTSRRWFKSQKFWSEKCRSQKPPKTSIFTGFTHPGESKIPSYRGVADTSMAQETDAWTQGQGPIAPEFWFSALKALFWKSNFQFFSKFSILGIFWLKNSFPEQKNRKNLNFLKSPAKSFCVPLSVPNSSPDSLGTFWVPPGPSFVN